MNPDLVAFLCLAAVSTGCIVHDNDLLRRPGRCDVPLDVAGLRRDE